VVRTIGEGGMGIVYEAERADDQFRKRVAIKLIKRGMDSDMILRRFRQERQILAALNHPNIAALLDGGVTDEGQPYLVMEYVDGQPINAFVAARGLHLRARLELFSGVCAAVHFAHQNLIVHRDLKPSNVLVTPDGAVKLLDFGVAKLLRTDLDVTMPMTQGADRVLTPAYASPEQLRGESVTTASDVYSLGVILYELLAGKRPFEFGESSLEEVARVVSERVPSLPSETVLTGDTGNRDSRQRDARRIAGELDNIVLMAMRKEPSRRYSTAAALQDDIDRYLDGRPVVAQRDSAGYRMRKFVLRHKRAAVAAALLFVVLIGGLSATLWQAREAFLARGVAEQRMRDLHALTRTLIFDVHNAIADLPGSTPARELVVERAMQYLDTLAAQSNNNVPLLRDAAEAYIQLAIVKGMPMGASTGDLAAGRAALEKARAIAARLVGSFPDDLVARRTLALAYEKIGDQQAWTGSVDSAVASAREALAGFSHLAAAQPESERAQLSAAISHLKLADLLGNPHFPNAGDAAGALREYQLSRSILESPPLSASSDPAVRRNTGLIHERLGSLQRMSRDWDAALQSFTRALDIHEVQLRETPASTRSKRDVAVSLQNRCEVHRASGHDSLAANDCGRARNLYEELRAADPQNAQTIEDMARIHYSFALLHEGAGRLSQAVAEVQQTIRLREELLSMQSGNVNNQRLLVRALLDVVPYCIRLAGAGGSEAHAARTDAARAVTRAGEILAEMNRRGTDIRAEQELLRNATLRLRG
jgi:non-specific serine/threonine protein kinase/serine/threonine-protein kinase